MVSKTLILFLCFFFLVFVKLKGERGERAVRMGGDLGD